LAWSRKCILRPQALRRSLCRYDKALSLKPDLANVWLGRGNVFYDLKRHDEAFAAYDKALSLKPDLAEAWLGRGNVFSDLKRYDEAFAAYDKALSLKPDLFGAEGSRLHAKMYLCDWSNFDEESNHLIASVREGRANAPPFTLLAIPSSSEDQLQCAKLWIADRSPPSDKPIWRGERYYHDRVRVAYLSADFRQHPVSVSSVGMFECHDKSRFEITAISIGPNDKSKMRKRLGESVERFIDAKTYSDDQIVSLIKELEIDILIDLAGFTKDSRTNILARRSAPIQVNYLGYPGTMGASYIDYIIADRIVIPENQREFYAEKIVFLPNSYHVNDDKRFISDRAFTRNELGLPSAGFVFCCFNNNFKITPHVFDCWMRILKSVDGSVLWLFEDNLKAANNLRKGSVARGVNAGRLIFGTRMPLADHLATHRLADLCLDTLPYNAHSIATDALWANLPLLTCRGETFAGRVAASLLTALNLSELITTTLEDYEALSVDFAMHPAKLEKIKQKLVQNRLIVPLFDTKLSTKHIEAAFTAMYERYQAALAPDHIAIPR
jgi:predicted O-linked N-acetylglucosamine transferase (SPINDLY family)